MAPETADPALAARTALTLLRPRAAKAGVDLRLHGAGVDRRVAGSQRGLADALHRFVADALDAVPGPGGAVTVRITEPERGLVRIVVDTAAEGGLRFTLDLPIP